MMKSKKRIAIVVSTLFHIALIGVLCLVYLPSDRGLQPNTPETGSTLPQGKSSLQSGQAEDRMKQLAAAPANVSDAELQDSLESQIQQAKKLTDERKLTELESNLKRLESVANAESVREVSSSIARALNLDTDQYGPKHEITDGMIDIDSAQISDVVRTKNNQGQWQYESIMTDAMGRTSRVSLAAEEGATLYDTFELLERYPLARGVYDSVVMPMMQRMLEAEKVAADSARQAIRNAASQQSRDNAKID